jgi:hypothetical protein
MMTELRTLDMIDLDRRALRAAGRVIASRWPDTLSSCDPGAVFNLAVPVPANATDFERLLGLLGRNPSWTPPC